jgi:hypothetical protein
LRLSRARGAGNICLVPLRSCKLHPEKRGCRDASVDREIGRPSFAFARDVGSQKAKCDAPWRWAPWCWR